MSNPNQKPENRGGKREGAGRPPRKRPEYSQAAKERTWEAIKTVADELGYDVFEHLVRTASARKGKSMTAQGQNAMKIIKDILMTGESVSRQEIEVTGHRAPTVYLPEELPEGVTFIDKEKGEH